ncbi:MAG: inosine/xanthosine triphosphatase [Gemmatimonadetes bacterium]|nr:MAG: inosine/xanthosine triphosphatase [Gemmatimonadota bacterium]
MIHILVGSTNPVKIEATKQAFFAYFNPIKVTGVAVESGVPDQPIGEETFQGAQHRVQRLMAQAPADFYVGIEGGICTQYGRWFSFGAVCIANGQGRMGFGSSPQFELPPPMIDLLVTQRQELGLVMDRLKGESHTKQKEGAIGYFSRGVVTRTDLMKPAVLMALVPFLNTEFYLDNDPL